MHQPSVVRLRSRIEELRNLEQALELEAFGFRERFEPARDLFQRLEIVMRRQFGNERLGLFWIGQRMIDLATDDPLQYHLPPLRAFAFMSARNSKVQGKPPPVP